MTEAAVERKRVLIAGCGAVGSVFACLLRAAGHDVTVLGRPQAMRAVAESGLRVVGIWGDHVASDVRAVSDPAELDDAYDCVLFTCKAFQIESLLAEIGDRANAAGGAISLQNGLGNVEKIAAVYGSARVLAGRVIFGTELVTPDCAEVTVEAEPVLIGPPAGGDDALAALWARVFRAAGISCEASPSILAAVWGKVFYNAALNPMGALLGLRYGELAADPGRRRVMDDVIAECFAVASAEGVELPWARVDDYLERFHGVLVPSTAGHRSSMLQDLERSRPTEIDAICGEVCRRGERYGIETPCNRTLWVLVDGRSAAGGAAADAGGAGSGGRDRC